MNLFQYNEYNIYNDSRFFMNFNSAGIGPVKSLPCRFLYYYF